MSDYQLIQADARRIPLADESVHCVVTSPPYFALRDYGTAKWTGGSEECDHKAPPKGGGHTSSTLGPNRDGLGPDNAAWAESKREHQFRDVCGKCGARRVDSQIGLEPTPAAYVAAMVEVFREVRRVLHPSGSVYVNIGDSYASSGVSGHQRLDELGERLGTGGGKKHTSQPCGRAPTPEGVKPKDLLGIPWMLGFALRDDGWYLRSEIIWAKPNPMPESVTDRPTKAHETIFLLSKRPDYYFDAEAVREAAKPESAKRYEAPFFVGPKHESGNYSVNGQCHTGGMKEFDGARNIRSVWTIPSEAFPGAHFATYPRKLIEPCIKAGSSQHGCCPRCGAPWERETEVEYERLGDITPYEKAHSAGQGNNKASRAYGRARKLVDTTGWRQGCTCPPAPPVPAVVFDPFVGSGTTIVVANALGRRAIGCDLSAEYLRLAKRRIDRPHAGHATPRADEPMPLFDRLTEE